MLTKPRRQARARLASASAKAARSPEDPTAQQAVDEARRAYRALALEDYIRRTVDAAPPLTDDQRERLATILRGGARAAS